MNINIDKDIPVPNSGDTYSKHKIHIPWSEMEDGDSVWIDTDSLKALFSIKARATYYGKKHSCKFPIRTYYKYDDGNKVLEGCRIWKTIS